jgi:Fe-S-cluster containining protein
MQAAVPCASSIFERADDWFFRAKSALLGAIPCAKGCCRCCIGPFAVTLLDVEELRRGLESIPAIRREEMEARARRQIAAIEAQYPRLAIDPVLDNYPDDLIDRLVTEFADMRCPALQDDGTCGLYEFRPVACRTMGIPIESAGTVYGACEIQTFIPVVRLCESLRTEDDRSAEDEARLLERRKRSEAFPGDEVLLPYAFDMELNATR